VSYILVYADDIKLLGDDIDIIKKITEILTGASKKGDLEANIEQNRFCRLRCRLRAALL
jgi:hypothetical protein